MHLLVDAGSDRLPAAFGIELVDIRHEQFDLAPKHAAGRVDFLNGHFGAVQMIGVVGHAVGRGERRWNADQYLVFAGSNQPRRCEPGKRRGGDPAAIFNALRRDTGRMVATGFLSPLNVISTSWLASFQTMRRRRRPAFRLGSRKRD